MKPHLFDFWRSSASYRVRIALHLIGLEFDTTAVDIPSAEHSTPEHLARNPQGFLPVLDIDGLRLTQSLAILEYLDETRAGNFLPQNAAGRARVRALSYVIAMETHPVCNPFLVNHVLKLAGGDNDMRVAWMKTFIHKGLSAFEKLLDHPDSSEFCHGDRPGLADICLVPQVYNANRWGADISDMKRILKINANCLKIPAFEAAHPDRYEPKSEPK
jgi:maleylacetoacetate isomerase